MKNNESQQVGILTDHLEDFIPSLVTDARFQEFVERLFQMEKGKWHSVRSLCLGIANTADFFHFIAQAAKEEVLVVWFDAPQPYGAEYAYVHFYLDDLCWNKSALYNKNYLESLVNRNDCSSHRNAR